MRLAAATSRALLALALASSLVATLGACKPEKKKNLMPKKGFGFAPTAPGLKPPRACTFGEDQSCNDDTMASGVHGNCESDGTCRCQPGFQNNPSTGRCR